MMDEKTYLTIGRGQRSGHSSSSTPNWSHHVFIQMALYTGCSLVETPLYPPNCNHKGGRVQSSLKSLYDGGLPGPSLRTPGKGVIIAYRVYGQGSSNVWSYSVDVMVKCPHVCTYGVFIKLSQQGCVYMLECYHNLHWRPLTSLFGLGSIYIV